jgi:hypothetical protein
MNDSIEAWLAELRAMGRKKLNWLLSLSFVPWLIHELPPKLFEHWYLSTILESLKEHEKVMEFKPIILWVADHLWILPVLTVCGILLHAYRSRTESAIFAKYVRKTLIPRNPFEGMAAKINRDMGGRSPAAPFDLLLEIHVVNVTKRVRTIQRIEAEAEIEKKWMPLREATLSLYEIAFDQDKRFAAGGLRDVMARKEPLASLKQKLHEVPLHQGIGIQGWIAFEMVAENDQLEGKKTNFRVILVDSMEGRHLVRTIDSFDLEGRIVYS